MYVKKAGGKIFGATFTKAEKKAMDMEINRQIIEADRRYTMILTQWFSIPLRFTWALAQRGSDASTKPLPQNMTGLSSTTKCRMTTHGSAKNN